MKTIYKYALIVFTSIYILFTSFNVRIDKIKDKQDDGLTVEVKGAVDNPGTYSFDRGQTINDVFEIVQLDENADTSTISLNDPLYHKQVIVVPEKTENNLISINSASIEELIELPGIGIKTAEKIIEYRETIGSFHNLEELMNVNGIGYAKYNKIKELICL